MRKIINESIHVLSACMNVMGKFVDTLYSNGIYFLWVLLGE